MDAVIGSVHARQHRLGVRMHPLRWWRVLGGNHMCNIYLQEATCSSLQIPLIQRRNHRGSMDKGSAFQRGNGREQPRSRMVLREWTGKERENETVSKQNKVRYLELKHTQHLRARCNWPL